MSEENKAPEADAGLDGEVQSADVEALKAEVQALKDQVLRYAAEAENTRRRAERETNDVRAYAITNCASPWGRTEAHPFYEMRGVAERLFEQAGYVACLRRHSIPPHLHPGAAAAIEVGGQVVGALGGIHPAVAAHWEIDLPCAVLEFDLSQLAELPGAAARFRESSRFPLVRRDLAVLAGRDLAAGDLAQALRESAGSDCTSVELFDRYEGRGVPEGQVSLAFRLVFQREDRTLRDEEVNRAIERAVRMLDKRFGLRLR